MNEPPIYDWRGTPLHIGSTVVFATRRGSGMHMSEGTVLRIEHPPRYSDVWVTLRFTKSQSKFRDQFRKHVESRVPLSHCVVVA